MLSSVEKSGDLNPQDLKMEHGFVIRLKCQIIKKLRKYGQSNKPYTITVLPVFIQSYSRFECAKTLSAISGYVKNVYKSYLTAALEMGAENEKTFSNYLRRAKLRCAEWNISITILLAVLCSFPKYKKTPNFSDFSFYERWTHFELLSKAYCRELGKNQNNRANTLLGVFQCQYVMAILSRNCLALGP
ncbi:hypothetical protein KJ966_31705 [bacterium]|nr:hypothetical protein [bacterium]